MLFPSDATAKELFEGSEHGLNLVEAVTADLCFEVDDHALAEISMTPTAMREAGLDHEPVQAAERLGMDALGCVRLPDWAPAAGAALDRDAPVHRISPTTPPSVRPSAGGLRLLTL